MQEFQQKKKIRRILYSPVTLVVLAILLLILVKGVWGVYVKEKLSSDNLNQEKNELAKLEDREKSLAASFEYLKTDQGIENEIRTKFRAVKEGEKLSVIVDEKTPTSSTTTTEKHGFWYNLFH
jgi:cell division protein FtsB